MPERLVVAELPPDYGDARAEYHAVRDLAGIVDRSGLGVLEVTGKDRAGFLHALVSNDIKALAPGHTCGATLLDIHGKVQLTFLVWSTEDRILLVTPPGTAAFALEAFDKYLFSEKASFADVTADVALSMLAGPEAAGIAERVAAELTGVEVRRAPGIGETGGAETWMMVPSSDGARAWQAALDAGARPVGAAAFESLRIEAGTPLFGRDVDDTVLLPEIPNARLLSHTKGCYPGQEVVVRIRDRGHVNRMLRGLVMEGQTVPERGAEVVADGAVIGRVTSATRSIGAGRPIALGFVRRQHAEAGAAVGVRIGDAIAAAHVSDLPFSR
jgi:tRNA-modifying protein YgfZ